MASHTLEERARRHAERSLGASVVAIEFTLISVMVGVVLFPLAESATVLLRDLRFEYWPYIVAGLVLTLYLWAGVIAHSLTFIGWPVDFGHNLLYIVLALALAVQMHFLADPLGWFATSAISAAMAALTVVYDTRMIKQRLSASGAPGSAGLARAAPDDVAGTAAGPTAAVLAAVLEQQRRQLRLMPWYALQVLVPLALVAWLPGVFVERPGHLALLIVQMLFAAGALVTAIRSFRSWSPLILRRAAEELEAETR